MQRKLQYTLDSYGNLINEKPADEALAEAAAEIMKNGSAADIARYRMLQRQQRKDNPEEKND